MNKPCFINKALFTRDAYVCVGVKILHHVNGDASTNTEDGLKLCSHVAFFSPFLSAVPLIF